MYGPLEIGELTTFLSLSQQTRSTEHEVFLRDITLNSSGLFICEASSEAPFFKTVSGKGEMFVLDLPDSKPILLGGNHRGYKVGEWLDANCSSPNSKPPALLKWYINNEQVSYTKTSCLRTERNKIAFGLYVIVFVLGKHLVLILIMVKFPTTTQRLACPQLKYLTKKKPD